MILDFRFGNFRSFKSENHLSTLLPRRRMLKTDANRILPMIAVFGANASGKSNLFRALGWMRNFVLKSGKNNSTDKIPVDPFVYDRQMRSSPCEFDIRIATAGRIYRYGFSVSESAVEGEWLFSATALDAEERLVFRRNGREIQNGLVFKRYARSLLANSLLLSRLDQDNRPAARRIMAWFENLVGLEGVDTDGLYPYSASKFAVPDRQVHSSVLGFLRRADPTIIDTTVRTEEVGNVNLYAPRRSISRTVILRRSQDSETTLVGTDFSSRESAGTRKMFMLAGPVTDVLGRGGVLAIDELEAELHPLLIDYIIDLFRNRTTNPKRVQLIFTTHDVGLIDRLKLRAEQILICQKRFNGESEIYPLSDFPKKDRDPGAIVARYLRGNYGGIPLLDEPAWLYRNVKRPNVEER